METRTLGKTSIAVTRLGVGRAAIGEEESLDSIDKVERVRKLAAAIGSELGMSADQLATVDTIAHLCKTDLTTHLVGEFPDLQGQVGCYYALGEGLPAVVANGLRDHYLPRNVNDDYPSSDEAAVVGIADRVDTMVGIFGVGKAPTGSADPYASVS